jgi:hypothetical protein
MTSNEISRVRIQNLGICFECSTHNTYTIFMIVTKPISSQKTLSGFSKMKCCYSDLLVIGNLHETTGAVPRSPDIFKGLSACWG